MRFARHRCRNRQKRNDRASERQFLRVLLQWKGGRIRAKENPRPPGETAGRCSDNGSERKQSKVKRFELDSASEHAVLGVNRQAVDGLQTPEAVHRRTRAVGRPRRAALRRTDLLPPVHMQAVQRA